VGTVKYRHHLTFKWEEKDPGLNGDGWAAITVDADDTMLSDDALGYATGHVCHYTAEARGLAPNDLLIFLANHTVTTL
jgi:hypothetical protein